VCVRVCVCVHVLYVMTTERIWQNFYSQAQTQRCLSVYAAYVCVCAHQHHMYILTTYIPENPHLACPECLEPIHGYILIHRYILTPYIPASYVYSHTLHTYEPRPSMP